MNDTIDPDLEFLLRAPVEGLQVLAAAVEFEPQTTTGVLFSELSEPERAAILMMSRAELASEVLDVGRLRAALLRGRTLSYARMVRSCATNLRVEPSPQDSVPSEEAEIVAEVVRRLRSKLSEAEWDEMSRKAAESLPSSARARVLLAGGAGALAAANLAGFGLYVAATTGLAGIAGALGIVLPFGVYAGVSGAIGMVVGPAGWVALGAAALYQYGKPSQKRMLATVLAVAAARALTTEPDIVGSG